MNSYILNIGVFTASPVHLVGQGPCRLENSRSSLLLWQW